MPKLEVKINKNELLNEVRIANRVLDKKPTLKVSESIILEFNNNELVLKATDGVNYFVNAIACDNNINDTFGVDRDLFQSTLNAVNKEELTLIKDDNKVSIIAHNDKGVIIFNSFVYALDKEHIDSFPDFPNTDLTQYLTIATKLIKDDLEKSFCYDKQGQTEALKGVHIAKKGDTISFTCSDRHRISIVEEKQFDTNMDDFSIIINHNLITEIKKVDIENIILKISDKKEYIILETGNRKVTYPLIQAIFPDTSKLFPNSYMQKFTVKTQDIKSAVDSISFIASKNVANIFKLNINANVEVSASNQDMGYINNVIENATIDNDTEIAISLNNAYVKEAINSFKDNIVVEMNTTNVTMYSDKDIKYKHLILGLRSLS